MPISFPLETSLEPNLNIISSACSRMWGDLCFGKCDGPKQSPRFAVILLALLQARPQTQHVFANLPDLFAIIS